MYTCINTYIYAYIRTYTCVHKHIQTCKYIGILYIYIYIDVHTYINTYTYIHNYNIHTHGDIHYHISATVPLGTNGRVLRSCASASKPQSSFLRSLLGDRTSNSQIFLGLSQFVLGFPQYALGLPQYAA